VTLRVEPATQRHLLADCWQTTLRGSAADALCLVELRGFEPLTPCMPCSFGPPTFRRSGASAQRNDPPRVTVIVRWIPLVTAAYGTRVARPAITTRLTPSGHGSQLGPRVRPVPRRPPPRWQESGGLAAAGAGKPRTLVGFYRPTIEVTVWVLPSRYWTME
jgi:hypothetical protein